MNWLWRLMPSAFLLRQARFDFTDGSPINAAAAEYCRRNDP